MEETIESAIPNIVVDIIRSLGNMLPDPDDVSTWDLESKRKIYMQSYVDDSLLAIQRRILRWNIEDKGKPVESREPIWLYLMSYGGEIDYMWTIIDTIKMSATPVYTVNLGVCDSAAGLIFISGHRRFMFPTGRVIIHEGSAVVSGDAVKVMDQTELYKKQLAQMKEYVLANTKIPRRQLMKKRSNDWELDAKYCLENGVCDVIISSLEEIC